MFDSYSQDYNNVIKSEGHTLHRCSEFISILFQLSKFLVSWTFLAGIAQANLLLI